MNENTNIHEQFPTGRREHRISGKTTELEKIVIVLSICFALVFGFVRPMVAAPFHIPSESMEPTVHIHDRVLANKFIYDFTKPDRGDVVIFEDAENPNDNFVKRVVGIPGDRIAVRNGMLIMNGSQQREPYVASDPCNPAVPKTCSFGPVKVPQNHVFVMGDNRAKSYDSRWFGPVPEESIVGDAFVRFWPPERLGKL